MERMMPGNRVGEGASVDRAGLDVAVYTEQIQLLNRQRAIVPVNLLIAGGVSVRVWPLYPVWVLALWLGLFSIVILARSLLRYRYRSVTRSAESARRWGRFFVVGAFVTGCLWGLAGSVILVTPDPAYHIFIVFVLGGMMAGGILGNAAYLPAMLGFMLPVVLPAIAALVTRPDIAQIEMGLMLAAFAAVVAIVGRNINNSIIESLRLRFGQNMLSIKLRASEAAMPEAQAIARVGSWDFDLRTNSLTWSTETFRIFGADPATSKPSYEGMLAHIHPDDRSAFDKTHVEFGAPRMGHGIDHRIVMDDGAIKCVHQNARTTYDAEGRALRLIGIVQDITERKSAEDRLQFANVLLTTEMEASPDGILVVDANRKIATFNQRFADMWKIPLADLAVGKDDIVLAKVTSSIKDPRKFSALVQHLYDHPGETSQDELETTDGRFIDRHTATLHTRAGPARGRDRCRRTCASRRCRRAPPRRPGRKD
jgi:PAS domain S-box-containing protein